MRNLTCVSRPSATNSKSSRAATQSQKLHFEATRNHRFVFDYLNEHPDISVTNPYESSFISDQPVKNNRLDVKRIAVLLRADALPANYYHRTGSAKRRSSSASAKSRRRPYQHKNRVLPVLADPCVIYDGNLSSESGREFLHYEEFPLSETDHELIEADLTVIDMFDERISRLTAEIDELSFSWNNTQLLMTILGIATVIAATIKTGVREFGRFGHKTAVVSYAGLNSAVRQSGDKKTIADITK